MTKKRWLITFICLLSLLAVLLPVSIGVTWAVFTDTETSGGKTYTAWASHLWTQTTQADFSSGVLNNVDITSSPGDVKIATSTFGTVTDNYTDTSKIASWSNLVETSGGLLELAGQTASSTLTILPGADKTPLQLTTFPGNATTHVSCVQTNDGDTSYVYAASTGGYLRDMYSLDHVPPAGGVSRVTIYIRARAEPATPAAYARTVIHTTGGGGQDFLGPQITLTNSYAVYSTTYYYFPGTTTPWTIGQLNSASLGVDLWSATANQARCTEVWMEVDYGAGGYLTPGTLTSTNLLSGITHNRIVSFVYSALAIPTGTAARVQFSQDNTNWYSSSGVLSGWDTLSVGTNTIGLSSLGWTGNFYYRLELSTTVSNSTPVMDYVSVNWANIILSGTIASQVLNTTIAGATWDMLSWDETLVSGTNIAFEVRASNAPFLKTDVSPAWISVGGTSPITAGLPSGQYKQWRATLTTANSTLTPVLHEVRVWYDP